ncbi:MAG: hypothetical protein U0787_13540 [Polyangia bacterium]
MNELPHRAKRDEVLLPLFFFKDDLRQRHRRQVFFAAVVENLNLFALANHQSDLFERHILAALRVVELAVTVSLDDARLCHLGT